MSAESNSKNIVIDANKALFEKIFKENQELRESNQELSRTLTTIEKLARERELQHKKFAELEDTVLKAVDLEAMLRELKKLLKDEFSIPIAGLSLIGNIESVVSLKGQQIMISTPAASDDEPQSLPGLSFIGKEDYQRFFPNNSPLISNGYNENLQALLESANLETLPIGSYALIPMLSRGRALGLLNLASPDPEKFVPGTATDAVESLGRKLATVIENSLLMTQLRKLMRTDQLTGLYNRRAMDEILPLEFARARRYNHPLSLIMIDLDNFKQVNDRFGHTAGDRVLAATGKLIKDNIRRHDTGLRYGGDEFTIILPDTDQEQGRLIIEKLRRLAILTTVTSDCGNNLEIKMSAGLASFPATPAADADDLKKAADLNLYQDKEKRK
ncbi:MAG: sensor domain-containing diguanylate cyclase, partial [Deltaproteobacteria bacterium]|nr:sensor domain-containing diguanylate cyclase [Deltaproteobacteria bacterium]